MRRGEIVKLGPHRLMCGNAADGRDVQALFSGRTMNMVFTSPPYLDKRNYGTRSKIAAEWTDMMVASTDIPHVPDCQVFVNLGLYHSKNEWHPYWNDFLEEMRAKSWRRFGFYIWDTNIALPGDAHGRLLAQHEMIFHLNKKRRGPHKTQQTIHGGAMRINGRKVAINPTVGLRAQDWNGKLVAKTKPLSSIVKATRSRERNVPHPAKFPVSLASQFIESYSDAGDLIYDPFVGSGTTVLAADALKRVGFGMELNPDYCEIVIERYNAHTRRLPKKRSDSCGYTSPVNS